MSSHDNSYASIDILYEKLHNHQIKVNNREDYIKVQHNLSTLKKITSHLEVLLKNFELQNTDTKNDLINQSKINCNNNRNSKSPTCYICKTLLHSKPHDFYSQMCIKCGNMNKLKRDTLKDLKGKVAIVTGGRVKIGFETTLRLLRCGCDVLITTRFAKDALERYSKESDHTTWIDNLKIFEVDFLNMMETQKFVDFVYANYSRLDYLINNAAQTIDRPPDFYNHLLFANPDQKLIERIIINPTRTNNYQNTIKDNKDNKDNQKMIENNKPKIKQNSLIPRRRQRDEDDDNDQITVLQDVELFPPGQLDQFGQQMDLRTRNSWVLEASDISFNEFAKVQLVNNFTPFGLVNAFIPLLKKDNDQYSWIINVTSMEGIFNYKHKNTKHVHTNMAKAALNMLTRTSGKQLFKDYNIIMCAVETGWNNSQYPLSYEFKTPLDCLDGAMRILDPIFSELKTYGVVFKDYQIHSW
jgi:NAD(P)-dependent dehydrogenase (short-subunit alcohol dehydrogenase family)